MEGHKHRCWVGLGEIVGFVVVEVVVGNIEVVGCRKVGVVVYVGGMVDVGRWVVVYWVLPHNCFRSS